MPIKNISHKIIYNLLICFLVHGFTIKPTHFVENVPANDIKNISSVIQKLGKDLENAFHNKSNVQYIRELVAQGAPVNWRLDYGLEIQKEADFVAAFKLLLGGTQGKETVRDNAFLITKNNEHADALTEYVWSADEIYNVLKQISNNNQIIDINPDFIKYLKDHALTIRANPDHQNNALIIAAGLRSPELVKDILNITKDVNAQGYFGDTAAVWSAILLDVPSLTILLENGANIHNIGITQSSLLHWVVVAAQLDNSTERINAAQQAIKLLCKYGASFSKKNILGKTPLDYAFHELKLFMQNIM